MPDFRCHRDDLCGAREVVRDPVTGDHLGYVGAEIDTYDGLCEVDTDKVRDALERLPGDTAELTTLLGKPLHHEFGDVISRSRPGGTLPLREHIHSLRALIDHEVTSWARSVGDDSRVEISRETRIALNPSHTKIGLRVQAASELLRRHLPVLLELADVEHRARSLGVRRGDGHDEDVATRYGDDIWVTRDGLAGALGLLDLHEKVWRLAARHTSPVRVFIPCPQCGYMALKRELGDGKANCSWCHHTVSEKHLSAFQTALANSIPAA